MSSRQSRSHGVFGERFYRSVAETLALLRAAPGRNRRQTMVEVAGILSSVMQLPLVWIGRREPGSHDVDVLAAAGPAADYADTLHLSDDVGEAGGRGPVGLVLRGGKAHATPVDAPEFAPWREAAERHGLGVCLVAAANTQDGGQVVLCVYLDDTALAFDEGMLDWAQRLADELGRFWDHQQLLERSLRLGRFRAAQRSIQQALLEITEPEAIYQVLVQSLVDVAGARAADVLVAVDDEPLLRRVALAGELAEVVRQLPGPPRHAEGAAAVMPTVAYMHGKPTVRIHPRGMGASGPAFHQLLRAHVGAVGCWPLFAQGSRASDAPRTPLGVFVVFVTEMDAFDEELRGLLDEIANAVSLALQQQAQRRSLQQEKEQQTFLALHDDLTGLPNRRALEQHLEQALIRAERSGRLTAVGMLDLDDLKPVNDVHGHAAGDQLLVEVANRFRQILRGGDYVARLGGDEFVLVLEGLDNAAEVDGLLARLDESLRQPLFIGEAAITVGASLGLALYAKGCGVTGEHLLRRADQAMYRMKALKRHRPRWWAVVAPDGVMDSADEPASIAPHGSTAAAQLAACAAAWLPRLPGVAAAFAEQLRHHEGIAWLLEMLPAVEFERLQGFLLKHLQVLVQPDLDLATHRNRATHAGEFYAACGLEEVWLLEVIEQMREALNVALGSAGQSSRQGMAVVLQRLGLERQWLLESMRELQRRRVSVLARLNALAWSAESYLALMQGVADILVSHKEVVACAVGRPDADGKLIYEAAAGGAFTQYLGALTRGETAPIMVDVDRPEGRGPSGRAWRTATIQRCGHFASDPAMFSWRDLVPRLGVVSSVAIPLCPSPHQPVALLALFSPYAGGFRGEDQQAFVEQIKTVLELALVRLAPPRPGTALLTYFARERWRSMVSTEALEMYFQPIIRLADGQAGEIEALARLRDTDGSLLGPGRFMPALGADDLFELFQNGLGQAVACRAALLAAGHAMDISINAPAVAMEDARYADVVMRTLAERACPPEALLLEILESAGNAEPTVTSFAAGLQTLKALGVGLVEDDLGAGYSSLIRLRQWPFDRIKIDQAIVGQARHDPLGTLRFLRQLIRIGHELDLEVVVEGLESPDLVEAVAILGADFGQGYALACPMSAESLQAWLATYRGEPVAVEPRTGMGALAGELRWEERFHALPAEPSLWARHAGTSCEPGLYLRHLADGAALLADHEAMHQAALDGPFSPGYRKAREAFLHSLVDHVLG